MDEDFRFIIKAVFVVLFVIAMFGGCFVFCGNFNYSSGERIGVINKCSEKGIIWKTWECEMVLEGMTQNNSGIGANLWEFSIDNTMSSVQKDKLIIDCMTALRENMKVKVEYSQVLLGFPWRGGTSYYINSIAIK